MNNCRIQKKIIVSFQILQLCYAVKRRKIFEKIYICLLTLDEGKISNLYVFSPQHMCFPEKY